MSTAIPTRPNCEAGELPAATPLNEAVWQAWLLKGRLREERNSARRLKALHWLSLAGLLWAGIAVWSRGIAAYGIPIRFLVAAGAMALMVHALSARQYVYATVFGALAILYNPVAPFLFSEDWALSLIMASAIPFVVALTRHQPKLVPNE